MYGYFPWEEFQDEQGWTDVKLFNLIEDFLEDRELMDEFLEYLKKAAEQENE